MSDTGGIWKSDKENVSTFDPVETSSTKFAFIMGQWQNRLPPFMENEEQMRNFMKEGGTLPDAVIAAGSVGKCYEMSSLVSESRADKIVNDIIRCAQDKSWPFKQNSR